MDKAIAHANQSIPHLDRAFLYVSQAKRMIENERILLQQLKQGDHDAFETLFRRYQPLIFRITYLKTKDYVLAQDVVQETFVKVWQSRTRIKPKLSFLAYLHTISSNLIKDHTKRKKIWGKYKSAVALNFNDPATNPEDETKQVHLREAIQSVLRTSLPAKCRLIFLLSRVEGKSNQDIADTLNISKKTVENQLYHALKIIRRHLSSFF